MTLNGSWTWVRVTWSPPPLAGASGVRSLLADIITGAVGAKDRVEDLVGVLPRDPLPAAVRERPVVVRPPVR
eukprot:4455572-Prymnesium_polylepis.1